MKKTILLLLLFISGNSWGMIRGEGRFASRPGDSGTFIKNQLKYQAFRDIITQELYSMKLDPKAFWQNYNNQFEDSFLPVRQKLQESFEQKKLSAKKYQRALRTQRLNTLAKYKGLGSLVKSYSEKSQTRSPNAPHVRFMEIDATLDRRALAQLYFKTVQNKQQSRKYRQVYLSTDFQLRGENWSDLGVTKKSDFTETLKFHWKKWFEENDPNIKDVVMVEAANWEQLKNHLRVPYSEARGGHYQNSNTVVPRHFQDSLWILVKIYIQKIKEVSLTKKRKFHIKGELIMVDLSTRKIVSSRDFSPVSQEYSFSNRRKLSSGLATLIWKLPLPDFREKPARTSLDIRRMGIAVRELSSIRELLQINQLLINKGLGMAFEPSIAVYSGRYGIVELAYRGDAEKALKIVRSLDQSDLEQGKKIVAQDPFSFVVKTL